MIDSRTEYEEGVFYVYGYRAETAEEAAVRVAKEIKESEAALSCKAKLAMDLIEQVKKVNTPAGVAIYEELRKIVGA